MTSSGLRIYQVWKIVRRSVRINLRDKIFLEEIDKRFSTSKKKKITRFFSSANCVLQIFVLTLSLSLSFLSVFVLRNY